MSCLALALAGVRSGEGSGEAAGRQKHQKEFGKLGCFVSGESQRLFLGNGESAEEAGIS